MKTITLTDYAGQPLHSRHVSNAVFDATTHARVAGNWIVALYGAQSPMPKHREGIHRVAQGVIRLAASEPCTPRATGV